MKKIFLVLAILVSLISLSTMSHAEPPILQVGDIAFKLNDFSYFDIPDSLLQPGQAAPPGTGSGRICGLANVTTIHKIIGGSLEAPILDPLPLWSASANDFLQVRFGGLIMSHSSAAAPAFPYDIYFGEDSGPYLSPTGNAYIEVYSRTTDGFVAGYLAGFGDCSYGSFGQNIALGGTLWLDLEIQDGVLPCYDLAALNSDLEKTTVSALTTAASTIYATIVSGTAGTSFAKGVFPLAFPNWGTSDDPDPNHKRADIKLKVNLTALYDQTTNTWNDPHGWTNESQDPVTGRVVEEQPGECRVTAGGNKDGVAGPCVLKSNGMPDAKTCANDIEHTWGGQAGAPPRIDGNWNHHCKESNKDNFGFHSNDLFYIMCSDPGPHCEPAGCYAPSRQIDFAGIGRFTHKKGIYESFPDGDLCFQVHLEDIGEPGRGGKWSSSVAAGLDCQHCPGTPIVNGNPDDLTSQSDCRDCTDYYEIKIYDSEAHDDCGCTGNVLWVNGSPDTVRCGPGDPELEGFFTRAGNVQMHRDNNGP